MVILWGTTPTRSAIRNGAKLIVKRSGKSYALGSANLNAIKARKKAEAALS
jgi:hypothetical protein